MADIRTELTYFERVADGKQFPLKAYTNGSSTLSIVDSFLIYARSIQNKLSVTFRSWIQLNSYCGIKGSARQVRITQKQGLDLIEDGR